jgi:heme-degrading monooxygenase HmoA
MSREQNGFIGGYHLREQSGRLMSVTVWDDDAAMTAGEAAVARRPADDHRGIRPDRLERSLVDGVF